MLRKTNMRKKHGKSRKWHMVNNFNYHLNKSITT